MAVNSIRRLFGNFASLLTSEVVNRATTFVLYALVARYLSAFEFGQLSLAFTLFFVFQVFGGAGLRTFITREVARDKTKTSKYLVNGSTVVVACSLLSMIALFIYVRLVDYSQETTLVILLLCVGVLPFSLSTVNKAVFQAWERMHYIALTNVPVHLLKVGAAFFLLYKGYSVIALVFLILASYVIILTLEWSLMLRKIIQPRLSIDRNFCFSIVRSATTFLGITGIMAINTSLTLLLLSKLANESEVGLYNAGIQLITPLMVICETVVLSAFPRMSQEFARDVESLKRISGNLIELLLAIILPAVVGLSFLAEPVFLFLYGNEEFVLASSAMRILAWGLTFITFTSVLGRALLAGHREKSLLRIILLNTLVNLILGLILISRFGLIGAAVTSLVIASVNFLLHYSYVSSILFPVRVIRMVWRPAAASACMAGYLALVQGQSFLLIVVSACAVYAVSLFIFMIWSNGGLHQFMAKYQHIWTS
jgi:O-antigen/teichoic acid export membrane protein